MHLSPTALQRRTGILLAMRYRWTQTGIGKDVSELIGKRATRSCAGFRKYGRSGIVRRRQPDQVIVEQTCNRNDHASPRLAGFQTYLPLLKINVTPRQAGNVIQSLPRVEPVRMTTTTRVAHGRVRETSPPSSAEGRRNPNHVPANFTLPRRRKRFLGRRTGC